MTEGATRHSAYCEAHGLHYDPGQPGCALCRRGHGPTVGAAKSSTPIIVAGVVLFLAVLAWIAQLGGGAPATPPASSLVSADASASEPERIPAAAIGGKLDPEPLRDEIESLEKTLYHPQPHPDGLVRAVRDLAGRRREQPPPRESPAYRIWVAFGRNLERLETDAAVWGFERSHGGLVRLRNSWQGMRNRTFYPALWFEGQEDSPPETRAVKRRLESERDRTLELLDQLVLVRGELGLLCADAQAMAFQVPEVLFNDPEKPVKEAQWRAFRKLWLETYRERVPDIPRVSGSVESGLSRIADHLGNARRSLRLAPLPSGSFALTDNLGRRQYTSVPDFASRQQGIDRVLSYLDTAQRTIEQVSAKWH